MAKRVCGSRSGLLRLSLLVVLCCLLTGCGGGGSSSPPATDDDQATAPTGTARFQVDTATGRVAITSLTTGTAAAGTKAVYSGSAVHFDSTVLYDQPGNTGLKVLDVALTNRSGLAMGTAEGVRVIFSAISLLGTGLDIRNRVTVSTPGTLGGPPSGVAVGTDGAVYATAANRVYRLRGGVVSVLAGDGTAGYVDGVGTAARFRTPLGLAVNPEDGALIVADFAGHRVRRVDAAGTTTLVAGSGAEGGDDGAGGSATFSKPAGIAVDNAGTIYVAEQGGHRLRKIVLSGTNATLAANYTVSTLAGSGSPGFADGRGAAAQFNGPRGVALGGDGNLYVADAGNKRVRLVRRSGQVVTIAGTGATGNADGYGDTATFDSLYGICALPDRGRGMGLVVSDTARHTLRQLRLQGEGTAAVGSAASWLVQTLAGASTVSGAADGRGDLARFAAPRLLDTDASGNVCVADSGNNSLRLVTPQEGWFPIGTPAGGVTEKVRLANPDAWIADPDGSSYPYYPVKKYPAVAAGKATAPLTWSFLVPEDVPGFEFTVRVEAATPVPAPPEGLSGVGSSRVWVRHLAGGSRGFVDGPGTAARFSAICGMAELDGYIYAGDYDNYAIRRIDMDGNVDTLAGVQGRGAGFADGLGTVAQFNRPGGLAAISGQDCPWGGDPRAVYLFIADDTNQRVRLMCTPPWGTIGGSDWEPGANPADWQVATIAGTGTAGCADGRGDAATFCSPGALALMTARNVYVTEHSGNRVRALQWTGGSPLDATHWQVSLVAGDGSTTYGAAATTDGYPTTARFNTPFGLVADGAGYLYVADMGNNRIRRIRPGVAVTTFAGSTAGYLDAQGTAARFSSPRDITADPAGYLYVTDRTNHRLRRISPAGMVTTVAGTSSGGWTDGPGDVATFDQPNVLCITAGGDLCVFDHNVSLGGILRLVQRVIDLGAS